MKQGDLSQWNNIEACKNLLFFAQLVNELLFDYSIPSNRISTLNSHFLCLDAINVINGIERSGVNEGSLKPIIEELYTTLEKDITFIKHGENPLDYFMKMQPNGSYRRISKAEELNLQDAKNAVYAIQNKYFRSSWYSDMLVEDICALVKSNDPQDQLDLFRQTKSFLTELVNQSYSSRYITYQANQFFYRSRVSIISPDVISDFLSIFSHQKNTYEIILVADKGSLQFFKTLNNITMLDEYAMKGHTHNEAIFFKAKKPKKYIVFHKKSKDPFSAVDSIKDLIIDNVSIYRMFDHNYKFDLEKIQFGVYDESQKFFIINEEVSPVQRAKTPNRQTIEKKTEEVAQAFESIVKSQSISDFNALFNAIRAHDLSLDSKNDKNQLLDLWSIFEVILDISNKHTNDRIQQICVRLVPILKRKYLYSLFLQLESDIKNYSETKYTEIIGTEQDEGKRVQKICEFCLLDEYSQQRQEFLDCCTAFPLLKERIEYYNKALKTPLSIYQFVEKHSKRVIWQVMRIYRNRNMIVHNGESMPYMKLLIENLHSYVDDFLAYVIQARRQGFNQITMTHELYVKECVWQTHFQSRSATLTKELITEMLSM